MEEEEKVTSDGQWHLDKKVPITLVFTIAVQTIAFVWFLGDIRNDVDNNIIQIEDIDTRIDAHDIDLRTLRQIDSKQEVVLARLSVQLDNLTEVLKQLDKRFRDDQNNRLGSP